jgi:arsenite-transporting ATPase
VRLLLYSGKGGVGKTSLSAATAVRTARQGQRTLVVSTDAAHSLADALGVEVGPEPVLVAKGLHALEIDVGRELADHWGVIHEWLTRFMRFSGVEDAVAEEMAILPGMEELFSLLRVKRLVERGRWDLIVVDCAPTGETVRMLGVPEVLEFYFTRIFPIQRTVVRSVRPVARRLTEMPIPDDDVFGAVQALYAELEGMGELLRDPTRTSIRLVLNPERMVVRESQRLYTYLCLFGFPVDAVIANRVLPAEAASPWLERWLEIQAGHLAEARAAFEPLPFLEAPLFDREMVGLEALDEMARAVFGRRDPAAILHRGRPLSVKRQGEGYAVELALPFARKDKLQVWSAGDELVVQVDNQRRHVPLPRSVASRPLVSAALNEGVLRVVFGGKEKARHGR